MDISQRRPANAPDARLRGLDDARALWQRVNLQRQSDEGSGTAELRSSAGHVHVHPTYAVTVEREPLGLLGSWNWAREFKDAKGHRPGMLESLRWIEGERIAERAQGIPGTRLIYVGDRESDILALMVKARDMQYPADYLLRSKHDRKTIWLGMHDIAVFVEDVRFARELGSSGLM